MRVNGARSWRVGRAMRAWAASMSVACATLLAGEPTALSDPAAGEAPTPAVAAVIARARKEVERKVDYDASYVTLTFQDEVDTGKKVYPGGDLDPRKGVCADLVVRAYRAAGIDLQRALHEDILAAPKAYPFVGYPDPNIDQRRVAPLMKWLDRHARVLPASTKGPAALAEWKPGDVVVWAFRDCPKCSPDHIGLVSDRVGPRGVPLVLHNVGPHPSEDDVLDAWNVLRHFRVVD